MHIRSNQDAYDLMRILAAKIIIAVFAASLLGPGAQALQAQAQSPGIHSLSIQGGRAITGGGTVIEASDDLKFLENLINARLLYNPVITPVIEQVGPVYKIPRVKIRSNQYTIEYRRQTSDDWSFGVGIKYLDIQGSFGVPDTFINLQALPPEYNIPQAPYLSQVTRETSGRKLLATAVEVDANLYYTIATFASGSDRPSTELYGKLNVGIGRGWLGPGSGPRLEEVHGGLGLGLRYFVSPSIFLFPEFTFQYYAIRTAYSDPLNRTKILVNPRKGDLHLGRWNFGAGFAW